MQLFVNMNTLYEDNKPTTLKLISRNMHSKINLLFYGTKMEDKNLLYVEHELIIVPVMDKLKQNDIIMKGSRFQYGSITTECLTPYNIDFMTFPEECMFIDIFGFPAFFTHCNKFIFVLKEGEDEFLYGKEFEYDYDKDTVLMLGRFARIDKDAWKFHPVFKDTNKYYAEIKTNYLRNEKLNLFRE